jgi:hypothetical protein
VVTAIGAGSVAYIQYRSSKLFQLLQFLEAPKIRASRHRLFRSKEITNKDKWWEETENEGLAKDASDICASYDIVWRVASGRHRRFFRCDWAYSICWTHEALQTFLNARRLDGDKDAYREFTNLYLEAKRFDPRNDGGGRRSPKMKIEYVNQWLTALQSIAIIAGVIVAIWQLSEISKQNRIQAQTLKQTQLSASATLVLQFRDKLDGEKYSKISSAIQNHKTNYPLLSRSYGGRF